jgi:hypothetical protein
MRPVGTFSWGLLQNARPKANADEWGSRRLYDRRDESVTGGGSRGGRTVCRAWMSTGFDPCLNLSMP